MTTKSASLGIGQLLRMLRACDTESDGQLLQRFLVHRDEAAFAALVRRHGPMVLGVCHRILGNAADSEDAFQATFLVLVRKAASLTSRSILGDWLHGVARHTALKAKAASAHRQAKERAMARPETKAEEVRNDWLTLLDEELARLPEKYRLPILLCDLEDKTRREAADQLGWPEGTVAGRLARARTMLGKRLARHGLAFSGGALAVALAQNAASAFVPASLVGTTIKAATAMATGKAVATSIVSARVAALTEGVLKTMFLTKLKMATAVLIFGLVTAGIGGLSYTTLATEQTEKRQEALPEKKKTPPDDVEILLLLDRLEAAKAQLQLANATQEAARIQVLEARDSYETAKRGGQPAKSVTGVLRNLNAVKSSVYVETDSPYAVKWEINIGGNKVTDVRDHLTGLSVFKHFPVAKDATILQDNLKSKLADLKNGSRVALKLDGKNVVSITADGGTVQGRYVSLNEARNTIAVIAGTKDERKTYHLLKETEVMTDSAKAVRVKDLKEGMKLLLTLSAEDTNTVIRIETIPAKKEK